MGRRLKLLMAATIAVILAGCGGAQKPRQTPTSERVAAQPSVRPLATATSAPTAEPTTTPTLSPTPPPTASAEPPSPTREPRYIFPVQPPSVARYGICHHDYPASDIFAPIGSRFVAVTDGVVDWVSTTDTWDPQVNDPPTRGGLSVAIIGDDGVRYYGSHLAEIAEGIEPGVRVSAGQLLGLTGKSGDALYTDPHLHFGISHPTAPDDWSVRRGEINPYPYLNLWRTGENVTPNLDEPGGGAC